MTSISDFYILGGTLPRDARSYAVRKADEDLLNGLRKGQFCYVLTSRQMGKSSLMVRTVTRLRQENVTCLVIDLTATGQNLTEDQWYDGLLNCVAADLHLEDELDEFWQSNQRLGPLQRWMHALRSVVLTHVTGSVVIFVDEVDAVRSLPFSTDEFFAGVRQCYNRRMEDPEFNRLTFCLLGVASPADLIRDTRSTPFNIGQRIALTDFTEAEAAPLAEGLAAQREGESGRAGEGENVLLNRVLYWTHGHPYLTQRLCSAVSDSLSSRTPNTEHRKPDLVDRICNDIFLSPGAQATDDNLLFVRERLLRAEGDATSLLMLYDKVRSGKRVPNSETDYQISILRLSGIVRVENGLLCVRNRIYAHVFDRAWVRRSIPDEDLKRQKRAFRKGVLGSAVAAAALLLLFVGGFMLTHHQKHLDMHVTFSDGYQLIVNDITFGKEASYETGQFRWSALFGRPSAKITFSQPTLSMWLSHYNRAIGRTVPFADFAGVMAVDEHGHQFIGTWSDSGNATRFDFESFPRRSKTIRMQVFRNPNSNLPAIPVGEFSVPNPTSTMYPLWTPEPLPCTKSAGNLQVRLKSVTWSAPQRMIWASDIELQGNYHILPAIECFSGGRPTYPWQIESMQMSDATGNTSDTAGSVGGSLCIFEPAWKLRLRLAKRDDSEFAASETWTLRGAAVPQNGSVALISGSRSVDGVTINSVSLAIAADVTYPQSGPPNAIAPLAKNWTYPGVSGGIGNRGFGVSVNGTQPQIAVRARGLSPEQKLTIWATDAKGHRYNQLWDGTSSLTNNTNDAPLYVSMLPIPPGISHVDIHIAIHRIKAVEFMVRPPLPETAGKAK